MQAIRVTRKNRNKMIQSSPISVAEIDRMIREYDTTEKDRAIYFVPQSELAHSLDAGSWMTIPRRYLESNYVFDDSKIDDEYVEISRK